ncbi:MAG: FCD domain-containing protein [Desulfobacterales bacterium]
MFQTVRPTKVFQDVVAQIEEAILSGRLAAGETLPSERELKAMFGVSRPTLREALRVLEEKGLIEIRLGTGGGPVVTRPDAGRVTETLARLIRLQKVSLAHLAEFREGLEAQVAAQAARRRSAADIKRLRALLAQARSFLEAGPVRREEFLAADRGIHLAIADATGNPIYQSVLASVHENIHRYYDRFLSMAEPELRENYDDLEALVAAIARGDAPGARRIAAGHVMRFNARMQRRAADEGRSAPLAPRRRRTAGPPPHARRNEDPRI